MVTPHDLEKEIAERDEVIRFLRRDVARLNVKLAAQNGKITRLEKELAELKAQRA